MSKTKFNVLHTHSITINNKQFRVKQKTKKEEKQGISCCTLCDCYTPRDTNPTDPYGRNNNCIMYQKRQKGIKPCCYATIGWDGYLKLIKHVKNKI